MCRKISAHADGRTSERSIVRKMSEDPHRHEQTFISCFILISLRLSCYLLVSLVLCYFILFLLALFCSCMLSFVLSFSHFFFHSPAPLGLLYHLLFLAFCCSLLFSILLSITLTCYHLLSLALSCYSCSLWSLHLS